MAVVGQTAGGTAYVLQGSNLGFTGRKLADKNLTSGAALVTALYGSSTDLRADGYAATGCAVFTPFSAVICTTVPGIGVLHTWRVNVTTPGPRYTDNIALTLQLQTGYMKPNITGVYLSTAASPWDASTNTMSSEGGADMVLEGRDFGPVGSLLTLKYGPTGNEYTSPLCTHLVAHFKIVCRSSPGVGRDLVFRLQVGVSGMQRSQLFSQTVLRYRTPTVHTISAPILNTRGGETVTLTGLDFGPAPTQGGYNVPVRARYSWYDQFDSRIKPAPWYEGFNCRVLASRPHRSMECSSVPGIGIGHRWVVEVGLQWSPPSPSNQTTAYRVPVVARISGTGSDLANTPGGQPVILTGDQFGPVTPADAAGFVLDNFVQPTARYGHATLNVTAQVSLQYAAVNCRVTVADTQMLCETNEGSGKELYWGVTVGGQESGVFWGGTTNYAPPVVAFYSGPGSTLADTAGYQAVYITGKNMGPVGTPIDLVTYGPNATEFIGVNCAVSTSHVEVTCLTNAGAGNKHRWFLVIDGQGSTTPSTDYAPPEVLSLSGPGAADASTDGGDVIVLTGRNFATQEHLELVTYGEDGTTYTAQNCTITVSHTEITCTTVPGTGRKLRWVVTVAVQSSQLSSVTSSYGVPTITSIIPSTGATDGGYEVAINGKNFGLAIRSTQVFVRIDDVGIARPAQTDVNTYWTSARDGTFLQTLASKWIAELYTPVLAAANINGKDDHVLRFLMPEGFGKARDIFITVDGVPSDIHVFVYGKPAITNVAPDRIGVPLGYLRVFIDGVNFCASTACGTVLFDGIPQNPRNYSHGQIMVIAPDPSGTNSSVSVTILVDGVLSNPFPFSKPEPSFDASVMQGDWRDMDTRGGEPFFISGVTSIATLPVPDIGLLIGGRPCTSLRKSVDRDDSVLYGVPPDSPMAEQYRTYRLDCLTPRGIGRGLSIIIKVPGGQSADNTDFSFSYKAPTISDIQDGLDNSASPVGYLKPDANGVAPSGIPTVGRFVRITGRNFGDEGAYTDDFTARGGAFVTVALSTTILRLPALNVTDTELYFLMPAGQGKEVEVMLTVGKQTSVEPAMKDPVRRPQGNSYVRYKTPSIGAVDPQALPTRGGDVISITGGDFGTARRTDPLIRGRPVVTFTFRNGVSLPCALTPTWAPVANHSRIDCVLPEGQGKDVPFTVEVAGQRSEPFLYTYARPRVFSITPNYGPTSGATFEGEQLNMTLFGAQLGVNQSASVEFRPLYVDEGAAVVRVPASVVTFQNHSVLTFPMPQGAGSLLTVVVLVDGQESAEPVTFAYTPPVLYKFDRAGMKLGDCDDRLDYSLVINETIIPRLRKAGCYATRGGYRLLLTGESFSLYRPVVTLGSNDMQIASWSHNSIEVTVPQGLGDYNSISVTVLGRTSPTTNTTVFAYDPPVITSIMPNSPDATGDNVDFRGGNFGFEETYMQIRIGGLECTEPMWYNDGLIRCAVSPDTVGPKNMTLLIANRTQPFQWRVEEEQIILQCKKGWYGLVHELCVECSDTEQRGAVCPGGELYWDKVYSKPGWWRTNMTSRGDKSVCHPLRQAREACPVFQPCEPIESCLGNNLCSEGYMGDRCSECVGGKYYRVNGECIKCPNSPWAVIIGFVVGAMAALSVAYWLNSKNISLALISIGIDYFQIVAMFARTRIRWPPLVKQLFLIMSAFNLNLELVAPECALPEVTYSGKWLFTESLPLIGWSLLLLMYVVKYAYKRVLTTQRGAMLHSHMPNLVSTGIVVLRVLYIYITRTTFDVFNCAPTNPPDGKEYMAWNLSIVCFEPGGIHLFLLPFAIGACIVYVAGAPIFATLLLFRNSYACTYDQILRSQGLGNDGLTNPRYLDFRRKWSKLYMHFVPQYFYWEAVITVKKFLIAFVSLMFRATPSYQLALALLVLFAAYVLHMRFTPYLTHVRAAEVVREHKRLAMQGDPLHAKVATEMRMAATRSLKPRRDERFEATDAVKTGEKMTIAARRTVLAQNLSMKYTFVMSLLDYNTVEAVLLCCAILVNLGGIMFDSSRFNGEMARYYQNEYDSLAWTIITLMVASITYFLVVFFLDLFIVLYPVHASRCAESIASCWLAAGMGRGGARYSVAAKMVNRARDKLGIKNTLGESDVPVEAEKHAQTFESNPLVAALAANANAEGAALGGMTADDLAAMHEPPNALLWPVMRQGMVQMQRRMMQLKKATAALQTELVEARRAGRGGRGQKLGDVPGLEDDPDAPSALKTRRKTAFGAVSTGAGPKQGGLHTSKQDAALRLKALRAAMLSGRVSAFDDDAVSGVNPMVEGNAKRAAAVVGRGRGRPKVDVKNEDDDEDAFQTPAEDEFDWDNYDNDPILDEDGNPLSKEQLQKMGCTQQ